jgi:hypothetical protein
MMHKAFDATGLNVYKHIVGFGRSKSISYRLFASGLNASRVLRINKSTKQALSNPRFVGTLLIPGSSPIAIKIRKAAKRLRWYQRNH